MSDTRIRNRIVVSMIVILMAAPLLMAIGNPDAAGFLLLISLPLGLAILFGWMLVRSFTDRGKMG